MKNLSLSFYSAVLLLCGLASCMGRGQKPGAAEADATPDSITIISEVKLNITSPNYYSNKFDQDCTLDSVTVVRSDFRFLEIREGSSKETPSLRGASYWLRSGHEYVISGYSPNGMMEVRSREGDPVLDAEAMFFANLFDKTYRELPYRRKEPTMSSFTLFSPYEFDPILKKERELYLRKVKTEGELKKSGAIFQALKDTYHKQLAFLAERRDDLSPEFYSLAEQYFISDFAYEFVRFYGTAKFVDKTLDDAFLKPFEDEFVELKSRIVNDSLMFSPRYRLALCYYSLTYYNIQLLQRRSEQHDVVKAYDYTQSEFPGRTGEYILFQRAFERLARYKKEDLARRFLTETHDEEYRKYMDEQLNVLEWNQAIDSGKISSDVLKTLDGQDIELSTMFERYRGKVVYLDFWASWCGPCREMMPLARQHKEKFGDDVAFVYISTDDNSPSWQKASRDEKHNPADSYLISNSSEFVRIKKITSIPRYMILDREGKIIDDKAMRPDDERFEEKMREIINRK